MGQPSHWFDTETLGNRADFHTIQRPAELIIHPVMVNNLI